MYTEKVNWLITCAPHFSGTSVFFSDFFGTFSSSEDEALDFSNSSEEEESLSFAFRLDGADFAAAASFFADSNGVAFFLTIWKR